MARCSFITTLKTQREGLRAVLILAMAACKGRPARLIVGFGDTVVVHNVRPVQLSVEVFDAAGHILPDTGALFQWKSGAPVPVSPTGVITCTRAGDATLRASLGPLVKTVFVRCRPVQDVLGGGPVNLVLGDPPYALLFEAVDSAGRPVRPFTAQVTVDDSAIVTREGWRIRARASGVTGVDLYIGDSWVHWYVQVYEPVLSFDGIRPGQRLAIPVQLAAGDQRTWQLPPSPKRNYEVQVLPESGSSGLPRLEILGANCLGRPNPPSYACLAPYGAALIAYHPRAVDRAREWRGTVAVSRSYRAWP